MFVSRLSPDTTEEEIRGNVVDVLGCEPLEVEKLRNRRPGYASFRVTCEEQHLQQLLHEDAWDEGALVRPFIGRRDHRANQDSAPE